MDSSTAQAFQAFMTFMSTVVGGKSDSKGEIEALKARISELEGKSNPEERPSNLAPLESVPTAFEAFQEAIDAESGNVKDNGFTYSQVVKHMLDEAVPKLDEAVPKLDEAVPKLDEVVPLCQKCNKLPSPLGPLCQKCHQENVHCWYGGNCTGRPVELGGDGSCMRKHPKKCEKCDQCAYADFPLCRNCHQNREPEVNMPLCHAHLDTTGGVQCKNHVSAPNHLVCKECHDNPKVRVKCVGFSTLGYNKENCSSFTGSKRYQLCCQCQHAKNRPDIFANAYHKLHPDAGGK